MISFLLPLMSLFDIDLGGGYYPTQSPLEALQPKIARLELMLESLCDYLGLKVPEPDDLRAFITTDETSKPIWWDIEKAKGERAGLCLLDIVELGSRSAIWLAGNLRFQWELQGPEDTQRKEEPVREDSRGYL